MAVSLGDVLGGIGASLQGTGQEFMQNLNTRETNTANRDLALQDRAIAQQDRAKAQQGALIKAVQEDASAALRAMDAGDFAGALEIAHDHLKHAQGIQGYDPTRALHIATLLSQGDPPSIAAAHAELIAAAGPGYRPQELESVAPGSSMVNKATGKIVSTMPAKPENVNMQRAVSVDPATGTQTQLIFNPNDGMYYTLDKKLFTPIPGHIIGGQENVSSVKLPPMDQSEQFKGLTGEALMNALPENISSTVRNILDGNSTMQEAVSGRGPDAQIIRNLVYKVNPGFEPITAKANHAAFVKFNSGPDATTAMNLNTAIDHLDTLKEAASTMDNSKSPIANYIVNEIKQWTGKSDVNTFEAIRDIALDEVTKTVIPGAGAQADRERTLARIKGSGSPAQISDAITAYHKLMAGKMKELQGKYEATTQYKTGPNSFANRGYLSPRTMAVLGSMAPDSGTAVPATGAPRFTIKEVK